MYVRSLVFQSGQSLLRYCSQASSKIQKYLPAESFTTHGEAIAAPNTEVRYVFALLPRLIPKAADPTPRNNAPLLYGHASLGDPGEVSWDDTMLYRPD